jgi:hypothetical protein
MLLCRVSGVFTMPFGELPYPSMWQGEKRTVPIMNSCRHGDRKEWPKVTRTAVRARGEDTPSEPESSKQDEVEGEEEEEGEVTPPPHSLSFEAPPSLEDLFHKKVGVAVGMP